MSISNLKDRIPEFDPVTGLTYCGEDEDFYVEMLGDYMNSDHSEKLKEFFAAENWKDYAIKVHALKSTSRMLGFPQLGDACEELQFAAEKEDVDYLKANHAKMMETYDSYLMALHEELD